MKVCTDACLFGAWVAEKIINVELPVNNCLDIGTGTALLSLMLGQKNNQLQIDAVEIEENAFEQAKENVDRSPWKERINIRHADAKDIFSDNKYELILSNPPFFENDLLSAEKNKNIAKHDAGLQLSSLINIAKRNLSAGGYFAVLLPYHRITEFEKLAEESSFYLKEKVLAKQTPAHNFFRGMLLFSTKKSVTTTTEIIIKNKAGNYTAEFSELLKDYYLYL